MAYATDNRTATTSMADRFGALVSHFTEAAEKRRVYRTTLRELDALNNRELADLGLNRSVLRAVAYEAAYGK